MRTLVLSGILLLVCPGVAPAADSTVPPGGHWSARIIWDGDAKVQAVKIGDADPTIPGLEAVGVDYDGRVLLATENPGPESVKPIHVTGSKLTGLLIADIDPAIEGNEIYVGGYRKGEEEEGGSVHQIVHRNGKTTVRRVWEGDGFIHDIARFPVGPAIVMVTYSSKVVMATPAPGGGLWKSRVLHTEPPNDMEEGNELKNVVAGTIGGEPNRVFFCGKTGRGVLLDPARPGYAEVLHTEPGGIARLALDPDGSLWLGGNSGRILHLVKEEQGWVAHVVFGSVDVNHGVVLGNFPAGYGRTAKVAVSGYSGFCRLLLRHDEGRAYDSVTIFEDKDKTHWLATGDIVPGNDADEILIGSYANQMVLLTWVAY